MNRNRLKEFFSLPNWLSYFRIVLNPVFLNLYLNGQGKYDHIVAGVILIISGLSDFLDGQIARRCHMVTDFGKVIDPIADKLTQFAVAIALLWTYPLIWMLLLIIVIKDGMLALVGLFLFKNGTKVKGASWWGKVATAYFYFVVITLVFIPLQNSPVSSFLIITSTLLMLLAFVLYAKELYGLYQENKKNG